MFSCSEMLAQKMYAEIFRQEYIKTVNEMQSETFKLWKSGVNVHCLKAPLRYWLVAGHPVLAFKQKTYTGGLVQTRLTQFTPAYTLAPAWLKKEKRDSTNGTPEHNINSSCNRSRQILFDLILNNQFSYFCTLTFKNSCEKNDILQIAEYNKWRKAFQRSCPSARWAGTTERHNKGRKGLHWHLCIGGVTAQDLGLKYSSHNDKKTGEPIYNITAWQYGFSTCKIIRQDLASRIKVAGYIAKYITKQNRPFGKGKKVVFRSANLLKPKTTVYYTQTPDGTFAKTCRAELQKNNCNLVYGKLRKSTYNNIQFLKQNENDSRETF